MFIQSQAEIMSLWIEIGDLYRPDPSPKETTPIQYPANGLERGENMGKNQFSIEIFVLNLKIVSIFSNLNWFFAQTRKGLPLGFLISFRIIIDFQKSIKHALIFIKIIFFK